MGATCSKLDQLRLEGLYSPVAFSTNPNLMNRFHLVTAVRAFRPSVVRSLSVLLFPALALSCAKTTVTPTPTPTPIAPPVITCPASQSLTSPFAIPISVVYSAPSVAGGASPITTSCTPTSGATFPLGATTVSCTATDAQQRASNCSLTVTVTSPPKIRLTKFFAFGDSITYGENGQAALTTQLGGVLRFIQSIQLFGQDYPTVLQNALKARYSLQVDAITVLNRGTPGEFAGDSGDPTQQSSVSRFSGSLSGQQVALIMEGSNDVNFGIKDSRALDSAIANLQKMVRAAKSAGLVPYIATVPPMNPGAPCCRSAGAALVSGFDDRVRQLASSEGITLVDVYKAFNGDLSLLSSDGLHPNALGYQRIGNTFFESISTTLELPPTFTGAQTQRPLPFGP